VLLSLHDFNLVSAIADHVIVLQDGHQVSAGTAAEVLRPDLFQQVFATEVTIQPHPGKGHPLVIPR
jgi:iron complex transport system ATP-binding protein